MEGCAITEEDRMLIVLAISVEQLKTCSGFGLIHKIIRRDSILLSNAVHVLARK